MRLAGSDGILIGLVLLAYLQRRVSAAPHLPTAQDSAARITSTLPTSHLGKLDVDSLTVAVVDTPQWDPTATSVAEVTSSQHPVNHPSSPSSILHAADHHLVENKQLKETDDVIPSSLGSFERVIEPFDMDSAPIQIAKWKCRKTGLTVVWADIESLIISGYWTFATEIFDDSGIPHTLEHLCFLASKLYPHKGILDTLANRSFADGTNAWTAETHTTYELMTASSEGFLRLLPVYLDHLLYPLLTDEAMLTEVYHINGNGEEGGVVFSEMQGRENTVGELMEQAEKRILYPSTSGHRSNTGGLMSALRTLNVNQIRKYHRSHYHLGNLQLTVTGKLAPSELLKTLSTEVESILEKQGPTKPDGWKRPFLETASKGGPHLKKDQTVEVEFPQTDESMGEVQITWVGPDVNKFLLRTALSIIFNYLTDSIISPFYKQLIEIDPPFCTSVSIAYGQAEKLTMTMYLSSVPSIHLSTISDLVKKIISEEVSKFDMSRLKTIIDRAKVQKAYSMENDPGDFLPGKLISNFLYGTDSDLVSDLGSELQRYEILAGWSADQWTETLTQWLVDQPIVCVIGKPSAKLSADLESARTEIAQQNRLKHGTEGLKELADKLTRAQEYHKTSYPDELLAKFAIPALDSLHWIHVDTADPIQNSHSALQSYLQEKDPVSLPFFVQFNHIKSNFYTIRVVISPPSLPEHLLPLLPIYIDSFFSLPINKDGRQIPYEEVVHQLHLHTLLYDIDFGTPLSQTIELSVTIHKTKYDDAIRWISDLLFQSVFDVERLRVPINSLLQDISSIKRDGHTMAVELYKKMAFDSQRSLSVSQSVFHMESNLPIILKNLNSDPSNLISQMEELRSHLLKASSMRISVAGDIYWLDTPKSSWLQHFASLELGTLEKPLFGNEVLTPVAANPSGKVCLMSMPSIESTYAYHVAKGPQGSAHEDSVALLVSMNFLNAMESCLWNAIRGPGLAYSASFMCDFESGLLIFSIQKSPNSLEAFLRAGQVLKDLLDKKSELDDTMLESTKSSAIFTAVSEVATGPFAAYETFVFSALKGVSSDIIKERVMKAQSVTVDDVLKTIEKYFMPIFDPQTSFAAIASSSAQSRAIQENLEETGFDVEFKQI